MTVRNAALIDAGVVGGSGLSDGCEGIDVNSQVSVLILVLVLGLLVVRGPIAGDACGR